MKESEDDNIKLCLRLADNNNLILIVAKQMKIVTKNIKKSIEWVTDKDIIIQEF